MDIFREDGHLRESALQALAKNSPLDELSRLEAAEHLAWCDLCLQRYTDTLSEALLLLPGHSCAESVWRRIRTKTLRMLTNRYATAAAAVVLALTVVWGSRNFPGRFEAFRDPSWPAAYSAAIDDTRETLDNFFDRLNTVRSEITRRNDL